MQSDHQEEEAVNLAKSFIDSRHGNAEMLGFEVAGVKRGQQDGIWIVTCSLFPKIGWTERVRYNAIVDVKTKQVDLQQI